MDEDDEEERNQSNMGMRAPIIGYEIVDNRQKFTVRLGIWPVYIALIFICILDGLIFLIKFSWLRYMIYKSKESIVSAQNLILFISCKSLVLVTLTYDMFSFDLMMAEQKART